MKRTLHLMFIMTLLFCNINLFANTYGENTYQVTLGTGTDADNSTPFTPRHCYSWNETIYSGAEIGGACTISAISYHTASPGETIMLDELNVYMAVTPKQSFRTPTDWTAAESLIKVYSGEDILIGDTEWEKITLDIPFYYNGNDNLVIVIAKKTSGFNPRSQWYYTKDNASLTYTLFYGNDKSESIAEVPPTTSDQGTRMTYRANVMLEVAYGEISSPIVTTPNPIDFGYRPAASWTRPVKVDFTTDSTTAYILGIESLSPSFIISNYQAPIEVTKDNPASVSIKLTNSNVVGELNGKLRVTNNYAIDNIEMRAVTYSPVSPDVWEKAEEITSYPYSNTPDFDKLYNNYYLPGETQDGPDAVYKLVLNEATTLSVGINGENAKMALYSSDFNGKGGPDNDNYYGAVIDPNQPSEPEFPEVETPVLQGNTFSYNFNDGSLADWRTIDADGDRYNWSITSDGNINAGADISLYSFSYNPGINSKLDPDNYIVTRGCYAIDKSSVLEFDVRSLDPDNLKENYEVVVSTDGVNFFHLGKESSISTEWTHKTISLADYAGQNIVIGFRHFDVETKSSAILIDNIVLKTNDRSSFDKTEKYTVPAGTYYLAVSATERFSVNINAATIGGFNPVTEILAQEIDDNKVNLCWSWDFINNNIELSDNKSFINNKRTNNQDATVLGYDVYRKNNIEENSEILLLAENVDDTTYTDNSWGNAEMGLYQWGISVIYDDGNGGTYKTPTAYSNVIGKDMFTTFEVQLTTDNGNSPEGAKVSLYNIYEPSFKYEATADAEGRCYWDSFRKGTYRYSISLDGYKQGPQNELMEIWEEKTLKYTFEEIFMLGDLFVSTTGWAMWNHTDAETYDVKLDGTTVAQVFDNSYQFDVTNLVEGQSYKAEVDDYEYTWTYNSCDDLVQASDFEIEVDYKDINLYWTLPVQNYDAGYSEFKFDFENGTLNGWMPIDADGDGYTWSNSKQYSQTECGYQSWYSAISHSTIVTTPLKPDNYLTTTKKYHITETSKLRFNVSAENKNYSQEHYGIAISTKTNYNEADFKTIWEETLPKDETATTFHGVWYEKTIDLSEYAGQDIYIAFRHFNCTDQFWINIDNVELTTSETRKKNGEWFTYDNGEYDNSMGLQGASFYWGMMIPANDVKKLAGQYLTKVSMFDKAVHNGRFMIYIGGDKKPEMLVHAQDYSGTGTNEYVEYELTIPVEVTGEHNIWVIFNNYDGEFVAPCCMEPTNANGRWFSTDGINWVDIVNQAGLNFTWLIRAYIENVPVPNSTEQEVLGVMLYRDGQLLTETPLTEENFFEVLPEYGEYEYSLRVVYGGEEDTYYAMSCPQTISLNHDIKCKAPKNLHGQSVAYSDGKIGTLLEWPYTLHGTEWLHYDDGISYTGLGLAGVPVYWGIMFPAEDLEFYNGTLITKVSLFDYESHNGNILIYYGGDEAPEMLIHSQPYNCTGKKDFVEFELTSPIPVDASTNLWIVFNALNGYYPAPICKDTGNKNGRWMSTDGENWADIGAVPDLAGTFMVRAFVTSNYGRTPMDIVVNRNENMTFSHYNLYRGTSKDDLELIAQPTTGYYFDEVEKGTYYYQVTSTYFEDEIECESEPANSYNEPENNFIMVEVTSVMENNVGDIAIYPNPVKDELIIATEAKIEEIAIYDIYGRMTTVYSLQSTDFVHSIDVADLEIGIYFVNIKTDNGNIVKRFVKN